MEISKMDRYYAPVHFANFPILTLSLGGIGLLFLAYFTVYQVTATKYNRNILKEISLAFIASVFLGTGSVFLLLWVGIYV